MARKSSKTAHVMNLLAGDGAEPDSPKSEAAKENLAASRTGDSPETIKELTVLAQKASIQTQDGPLTPSPISIIDMSSSAPDPVAELIKEQLEKEEASEAPVPDSETPTIEAKEAESAEAEPVTLEAEPVETEPVTLEAEPVEAEPIALEAEPAEAESVALEAGPAENESAASEALENQAQAEQEPEKPAPLDYQYVNVMEYAVQNMVQEYMERLGVCSCGHCVADVTAMALTNLPAKYIVVPPSTAPALLSFYSSHFSRQIIVELIKACSIIKENPHH